MFGARSGSPRITFACLSIHPSVREGHQKWYVLEKQEAVPSSSWHLEAKLDLQLGLFHILSMVFKKCMITIDQSAVCTIIIIIMCHELVCHIRLQLWTIIAQPCDWHPSCILSYKHYTMYKLVVNCTNMRGLMPTPFLKIGGAIAALVQCVNS